MPAGIRAKLVSGRGASLSIALFLLLICTVVSAVVLVSGTVASGRLANRARMDQRHYSVISAVELVKDKLASSVVTVTETLKYTETESRVSSDNSDDTCTYVITSDNVDFASNGVSATSGDFAVDFAYHLVSANASGFTGALSFDDSSMSEEEWGTFYNTWCDGLTINSSAVGDSGALELSFAFNDGSADVDELAVTATVVFDEDGSGTVEFSSASDNMVYTVSGNLELTSVTPSPNDSVESTSGYTKSRVAVKTTTLSWTISDVSVGQVSS